MMRYIEFESAIPYFREKDLNSKQKPKNSNSGLRSGLYLLTDFKLRRDFYVGDCTICKSEQKNIGTNTISYFSKIVVPSWLRNTENEEYYSACFSLILSSIVSLSSGRNVKFFRNYYNVDSLDEIFIHMPLQFTGPGAIDKPDENEVESFFQSVSELYEIALNLKFDDYRTLVRACRLGQLAHQVKDLDHNLSYAQIVSSIEAVATNAFKVVDVVKDWLDVKNRIKEVARDAGLDSDFRNTLNIKLEQHYTGERFKRFLQKYSPLSELSIPSKYDRIGLLPEEKEPFETMDIKRDFLNNFIHHNKSSISFDGLKTVIGFDFGKLLKDSYSYRSSFYHEGKALQLNRPDNYDRYIKQVYINEENPYVSQKDFQDAGIDKPEKLIEKLIKDKYISKMGNKQKYSFSSDRITEISNSYYYDSGIVIRQIFYHKGLSQIKIISFNLLSQMAKVAFINYFKEKTSHN